MNPKNLRSFKFFCFLLLAGFLVAGGVFAAGYGLTETGGAAGFTDADTDIYGTTGKLVTIGLSLLGFVFFGYTLYAGIRWMIARGQSEYVEKAQKSLEGAIIGLVIVTLAYALATFILKRFNDNSSSPAVSGPMCESKVDKVVDGKTTYLDTCGKDTGGQCVNKNNCDTKTNVILKNCCPGGNDTICCAPKAL